MRRRATDMGFALVDVASVRECERRPGPQGPNRSFERHNCVREPCVGRASTHTHVVNLA